MNKQKKNPYSFEKFCSSDVRFIKRYMGVSFNGNIDLCKFRIRVSGKPVAATDVVTKEFVDNYSLGSFTIKVHAESVKCSHIGLLKSVYLQDVLKELYKAIFPFTGGTLEGPVDMGNNHIIQTALPVQATDAVNKLYVDNFFSGQILNPTLKQASQFLMYNGTSWVAGNLPVATDSIPGVITLVDDVNTIDSTKALTAAQGYYLNLKVNNIATGIRLMGKYNASLGVVDSLTERGVSCNLFIIGADIQKNQSFDIGDYFVVNKGGTLTATGIIPNRALFVGDWIVYTGGNWTAVSNKSVHFIGDSISYDPTYSQSSITATNVQLAIQQLDLLVGSFISKPLNPLENQFLKYDGSNWVANSLPSALMTDSGIVALSDSLTSTSTTTAATANSVNVLNEMKLSLSGGVMTGSLDMSIYNARTTAVPVNGSDAANKLYLDNVALNMITNPAVKDVSYLLQFNGVNWVGVSIPIASLTSNGIVVLDDSGTSTSTSLAATASSVFGKITAPQVVSANQYLYYDGSSWVGSDLPLSALSRAGMVQLEDTITSVSQITAATANSVTRVNNLKITNPVIKSASQYLMYNGIDWVASDLPIAATNVLGVVKLDDSGSLNSNTIAATTSSVSKKIAKPLTSVASQYLMYNGSNWVSSDLPVASTVSKGIVQLDNDLNSTSTSKAATASIVYQLSNSKISNPSGAMANQFLMYNGVNWIGSNLPVANSLSQGVVQLDDSGSSTSTSLAATARSASLKIQNPAVVYNFKYLMYDGTDWVSSELLNASVSQLGIVRLDDTGASNSDLVAATSNLVSSIVDLKITKPVAPSISQYLMYNGTSWIASDLPLGSNIQTGIVQLDDTGTLASTTIAATANSVARLNSNKIENPLVKSGSQYLQYVNLQWKASNLPLASTTQVGIVQLEDVANSLSVTKASTSRAVSEKITNPLMKSASQFLNYNGSEWVAVTIPQATVSDKGFTQLDNTVGSTSVILAATANSVIAASSFKIDKPIATLASQFLCYDGTEWIGSDLPLATTSQIGIVKLDDSLNSTSTTTVATANSATMIKAAKISLSGDTMLGPIDMGSNRILNLKYPVLVSDVATKGYVKSELALTITTPLSPVASQYLNYNGTSWITQALPRATTSTSGIVSLVNDLLTDDPTKALTASQGAILKRKIDDIQSGLTFIGFYDPVTGRIVSLSSAVAASKFSVGSDLLSPSIGVGLTGTMGCYFVVSRSGTTSSTATLPSTVLNVCNWIISIETSWVVLSCGAATVNASNVVFDNSYVGSSIISNTVQGAVQECDIFINSLITNPTVSSEGDFLIYNGSRWISSTLPHASTTSLGVATLINSFSSTSTTTAVTANAVNMARNCLIPKNVAMNGQYLGYNGSQWIATDLPIADLNVAGIVQLDDTISSTSTTYAATANAVYRVLHSNIVNPTTKSINQFLMYNGVNWVSSNLVSASLTSYGVVQLDDTGTSNSTTMAATARSLSRVLDAAILNPSIKSAAQYLKYNGSTWEAASLSIGSTTAIGIIRLDDTESSNAMAATANSVSRKISDPTTKVASQYLQYNGTDWIGADLPIASLTTAGLVQLDDTAISNSTTIAATANSLSVVKSNKITNPTVKAAGQYLCYNGTDWISVNLPQASLTTAGLVQLDDTGSSNSTIMAATANSLSNVRLSKIISPLIKSADQYLQYNGTEWIALSIPAASLSSVGFVQLDDSRVSTSTTLAATANSLLNINNSKITNPVTKTVGQYLSYDGTNWSSVSLPVSSTTVAGIVRLDNTGTSTSVSVAATSTSAKGKILKPTTVATGQYLKYDGSSWNASLLPNASQTISGIVQLNDTGASTSLTKAATANSVYQGFLSKIANPSTKSAGKYLSYNGTAWVASGFSQASTTVSGIVQLDDSGTSTSTTLAATANSVFVAYNACIANPASPTSGQYLSYNGTSWIASNLTAASTTIFGIVQLDDSGTSTSTTLAATANSVAGKIAAPSSPSVDQYLQYNGSTWVAVTLPASSTVQSGIVQLSDSSTDSSTTIAATAHIVSTMIKNPATKSAGQYLKYNGTSWIASALPVSSTTASGILQLDNTGSSSSTTIAATANSVNNINNTTIINPSTKSTGQYLSYDGTSWVASTFPTASTTAVGLVQLSNSVSSSVSLAATAGFVGGLITSPASSVAGQYLGYNGTTWISKTIPASSTTVLGIVQLDDSGTSTSTTTAATANSVGLKITNPSTKSAGQYLSYDGTSWVASTLASASTTVAGIVQLDDSGTSTSTTTAATANSVGLKITNPSTKSDGQYLSYNGTSWVASTLVSASTTVAGIVQLDDSGTSTSTTTAATANSVFVAYNACIANPVSPTSGQYLSYNGTSWVASTLASASTTVTGVVQLDNSGTSTSTTLAATANSVGLKITNPSTRSTGQYLSYNGTSWVASTLASASTTVAGIVQLDDSGTSTSTTLAATANSVGLKIINPSTKSTGQYLSYNGTSWVASTLASASTTVAGVVQLDDSGTSTSTTLAATANSVYVANQALIVSPVSPTSGQYLSYNGTSWVASTVASASTTVAGVVQLDDSGTSTSTSLAATSNSASGKITLPSSPTSGQYLSYNGTNWVASSFASATTSAAGIVQLDDTAISTSTTKAATANSVTKLIANPATKSSGQYLKYTTLSGFVASTRPNFIPTISKLVFLPTDILSGGVSFYLSTMTGMDTGVAGTDYCDIVVMQWNPSEKINVLAVSKTSTDVYLYQADFGSSTWGTKSALGLETISVITVSDKCSVYGSTWAQSEAYKNGNIVTLYGLYTVITAFSSSSTLIGTISLASFYPIGTVTGCQMSSDGPLSLKVNTDGTINFVSTTILASVSVSAWICISSVSYVLY